MKLPFFIPPPDLRSEGEIEADIADEIAFHLAQSAREFQEAGESQAAASALAKERFGNIDKYKRQLKYIALKERIMLQRINLALMVVVILVVGAVSLQVFTTQRYNTLALQAITTELANMKTSAQSTAKTGHVIVEGDLKNPGRYAFSLEDNETLNDLLAKLGVGPGKNVMYQGISYSMENLLKNDGMRILLRDGETAKVFNQSTPVYSDRSKLPGKWQQIDENGNVVPDGIVLNISDPNDLMNSTRSTLCRIDHPVILSAVRKWGGAGASYVPASVYLDFNPPNGKSDSVGISILNESEEKQYRQDQYLQMMGVHPGDGRWKIKKNGHLYLNLGAISPKPGEPLIFEKMK